MPSYIARPFAVGNGGAGTLQYYDLSIGSAGPDYPAGPGGLTWYMGPDELPGYIIAKSNVDKPTFWRSTAKTDESYLGLLRALYNSLTGTPHPDGDSISTYDSFLSTYQLYTTYEKSGSLQFIGINNHASFAGAQNIIPGMQDFTVEWFQKQHPASSTYARIWQIEAWPSDYGVSVEEGRLYFWYNGQQMNVLLPSWDSVWIHLAITRRNGTVRIFHNGSILATQNRPDNIVTAYSDVHIGVDPAYLSTTYYDGYITNLHFLVGEALYTEAFTPPTSTVRLNANTRFLMMAKDDTNKFVDSSVYNHPIEDSGLDPLTWSADSPFTY